MTLEGQEAEETAQLPAALTDYSQGVLWSWAGGVSDLCNSKPAQAQTYVGISWLRAKLTQLRNQPGAEESAGTSYLVRAMCRYLYLKQHCLYLKQQQELLIPASFFLAVKY